MLATRLGCFKRLFSSKFKEINDLKEFKDHLKVNPKILVDFYAVWCGPCKMISPILEKATADMKDLSVIKVNVDEAGELAKTFEITALPTVTAFKNGEKKGQFMGVRDAKFIENFIKESF